jgi:hypothetical protein
MESEVLLRRLQQPAIVPCPEPDICRQHCHTLLCFNIILSDLRLFFLSLSVALQSFRPWALFSFLFLYTVVGLLGQGISPSQDRYLHTEE